MLVCRYTYVTPAHFLEIFQIKTLVVNLTSEYVNNPINKEFNKFLDFTMFSKVFLLLVSEKCSAAAVNRARKMSSTKEDF